MLIPDIGTSGIQADNAPSGPVTYVNQEGTGDYQTIQAALDAAVAGEQIVIQGGTYAESIDFTGVPDTVRVNGEGNAQNVIIAGADTTSTRVTITGTHTLRELTVVGPSSGTNPAIAFTGAAGKLCVLHGLVVNGGGAGGGIKHSGAGILAAIQGLYHNGGAFTGAFFEMSGTGTVLGLDWIGNVGSCADFIKISDGTMRLEACQFQDDSLYSGTDFVDISGGTLTVSGVTLPDSGSAPFTNAVHVTGDGCDVFVDGAPLASDTYDLLVDPALAGTGSTIRIMSEMDFSKRSVPAGYLDVATYRLNFGTATGWASYVDTTHTSGSPQALTDGTRTQWTNNAGTKLTDYRSERGQTWASNKITPRAVGEAYTIRVDFTVDPGGPNTSIDLDIDIGSDPFGGTSVPITRRSITLAKGTATQYVSEVFPVYCLSTFVANGGAIGVTAQGNDVDIYDKVITLLRLH